MWGFEGGLREPQRVRKVHDYITKEETHRRTWVTSLKGNDGPDLDFNRVVRDRFRRLRITTNVVTTVTDYNRVSDN